MSHFFSVFGHLIIQLIRLLRFFKVFLGLWASSYFHQVHNSCRKDNIFRYGSDEFLILIENANRQIVAEVINRINTELQRWNKEHEKFPTELSFSVGWATTSRCKIEDMIRRADQMMYRDKEKFYKDKKREPR